MIMTKVELIPDHLLVGLYLMLRASQSGCDGVFLKHTALKTLFDRRRIQTTENAPLSVFVERVNHIFPFHRIEEYPNEPKELVLGFLSNTPPTRTTEVSELPSVREMSHTLGLSSF
jgi:hypothetical protein